MSTDKEEIALYYEAKMTKSENALGLKAVFTGAQQKNYRLQYHGVLSQWTMLDLTKRISKNLFA